MQDRSRSVISCRYNSLISHEIVEIFRHTCLYMHTQHEISVHMYPTILRAVYWCLKGSKPNNAIFIRCQPNANKPYSCGPSSTLLLQHSHGFLRSQRLSVYPQCQNSSKSQRILRNGQHSKEISPNPGLQLNNHRILRLLSSPDLRTSRVRVLVENESVNQVSKPEIKVFSSLLWQRLLSIRLVHEKPNHSPIRESYNTPAKNYTVFNATPQA